jgi:hypothetical protein
MWRTCSGAVEGQARVQATKAVVFGGEQHVVPGREALQLGPADPAGGERALVARCLELGSGQGHFGPGRWRLFGVQPGGLESVLVVVEDRCGAVEREAQHLAVGGGVVAGHRGHIGLGSNLAPAFFHDLGHRHDGALGGHHGGGADFKHLQDVRRIAGAECGDGSRHGLVVAALEGRHDLVVLLAGVEVLGQVVDPFTKGAAHGMPPLDFGLGLRRQGKGNGGHAAAVSCSFMDAPEESRKA